MADSNVGELERRLILRGQKKLEDELSAIYKQIPMEWRRYSLVGDAWVNFAKAVKAGNSANYERQAITDFMSRLDSLDEQVERLREEIGE